MEKRKEETATRLQSTDFFSLFLHENIFCWSPLVLLLILVLSHPFSTVIQQFLEMLLSLGLKKKKNEKSTGYWSPCTHERPCQKIKFLTFQEKKNLPWKGFSLCSRLLSASRYLFHVLNINYSTIQPKWTFAQGWNTPSPPRGVESPLYVLYVFSSCLLLLQTLHLNLSINKKKKKNLICTTKPEEDLGMSIPKFVIIYWQRWLYYFNILSSVWLRKPFVHECNVHIYHLDIWFTLSMPDVISFPEKVLWGF